ncbi:MAG TPA: ATP-binding protein, partial [Mesorhizobium sp.]|nr:ATP-binding protein [Mesorhizobium sp.]
TVGAQAAEDGPAKRVLMVHSFGSTAPPFTTHSNAFETTLTQEMGQRVDLDQVSLDMARYAQPDMEEPFVEFLLKRLAKWQPDLVVPVGSPAGRFVAKYRDRLFPQTPVIYTGMDLRTLPPGAFQNATFVGESFDLAGLVEDILQVAPDTNNIAVVLGASPLERYWTVEFRRAFEPFTNRVSFTWFNDLTFDQMLERVAKLPPRSFILIGLLLRDASGVTHNQDDALQRLHAVANAPINGMYKHQLGLGIVGGRLYHAEVQGAESARIAIRILRGEPAVSFPPMIIPAQGPRYDWRELQRWNISADRLPPGSEISFRQSTVWERYRWWIAGALFILALQAAMIAGLLLQRTRRHRAENERKRAEERFRLAVEASPNAIVMVDAQGKMLLVNGLTQMLFDYSREELIGQSVEILVPERFRTGHPAHRATFFGAPQARATGAGRDLFARRKDGSEFLVEIGLNPIHTLEGTLVLTEIVDITDRKRMELELQRNREELAHVTRVSTVGELTTSVAHELNQPLGAILSNAEAAEMFLMADPPALDEVRDILADIRKDDERASEVIRRMRSLLRKQELAPKSIEINEAVEEVLRLLSTDASARKVAINFERTTGLPRVWCDPVHFQQVVLNLVLNGMEAMAGLPEEKRQVVVRTGPANNGTVKIAVADLGPGIPVDSLPKLFEHFFTTKKDGMGMGLSIARTIVEAHHGQIWAENNSEVGATFYFTVPVDGTSVEGRVSRDRGPRASECRVS